MTGRSRRQATPPTVRSATTRPRHVRQYVTTPPGCHTRLRRLRPKRWHYGRMTSITAKQEVASLASDLIRIDTTNTGDDSGPGERAAAEHVAELLAEVGLEPVILESRKNRASVVTRIEGTDPTRPALLIHGHLDVVPADPDDWQVHPLSGELSGGCVWGRGAVDMKDMDAMMLAVVRQRLREGRRPGRD